MLENNPVQTKGLDNNRYAIGTCYVIIPAGVDRDSYVTNCYRNGRVSVQCEDGSFIPNIPIGLSILKDIDFPTDIKQLGSQLIYNTMPLHNQPIIVDRILKDDESLDLIENQFKLEKYTDSGSVSISGIAKDGNLFINVDGKAGDGGKIYINVGNDESTGGIVLNLKGDLQAELQDMVLNILKGLNIKTKEDININSESKVNLGDGSEPILKGDSSVTQLDALQTKVDLIRSAIENGVPIAQDGGVGYQASMTLLMQPIVDADFSNINSEKSFTE
jgi:hypothetical protein